MKKLTLFFISSMILAITCLPHICVTDRVSAFSATQATPVLATDEVIYMHTPNEIAANEDGSTIFVYDQTDNKIKKYDTATSTITMQTPAQTGVVDMFCFSSFLFVLVENANLTIKCFNENLELVEMTDSAVSFLTTIQNQTSAGFCGIKETDTTLSIYVQTNYAAPNPLTLFKAEVEVSTEPESVTITAKTTIASTDIDSNEDNLPQNEIFGLTGTKSGATTLIYATTSMGIYKLTLSGTNSSERIVSSPSTSLACLISGANVHVAFQTSINESPAIQIRETTTKTYNAVSNYTDITASASHFYVCETDTPAIIKLNTNAQKVASYDNNFSHPSMPGSKDIDHGKTIATTYLLKYPFSETQTATNRIPLGTYLSVLATDNNKFPNHYYCLYYNEMTKQNQLGYITKTSIAIIQKTTIDSSIRTMQETKLTKYPTPLTDSINTLTKTLPAGTIITAKSNAGDMVIGGISYYLVTTESGDTGYIPRHFTSVPTTQKTAKIIPNAHTTTETTLYADNEGKVAVMTLAKNQGIKTFERIDPEQKYTKVEFTTENGDHVTGYIQTSDITSDSLTTLQIVGIVLGATSVFVLLIIILFMTKYKKSKGIIEN